MYIASMIQIICFASSEAQKDECAGNTRARSMAKNQLVMNNMYLHVFDCVGISDYSNLIKRNRLKKKSIERALFFS